MELYDLEIYRKKLGLDCHRLKIVVKKSIEQEIRYQNFGARNGIYERNAVVKNQGTKQRVQRILGDCWEWKANGVQGSSACRLPFLLFRRLFSVLPSVLLAALATCTSFGARTFGEVHADGEMCCLGASLYLQRFCLIADLHA